MLKLKLQYFDYLMRRADSLEKTLMLGKTEAGGEGDGRGWDGWMASLTQWTWVWVDSGSWWWTGKPGVLWFMGSQRVGYDWPTKLKTFSTSQNTHSEPHCTEDAINFPDKSYQAWALLPHPFSHLHMCFLWSSSFPLVTVSKAVISLLQGTSKPLESIGGFHLHLQLVLLYISMSIHHKCVSLLLGHFSHSVVSDSLQPHELQHTRPPCPSPAPRVHPNPCPLSRWCHPIILSSVIPFSSCPQSFPASGSFQMSQPFASGGQSIGVSASTSVLPMNTQDWSPLGYFALGC